MIKSLSVTTFLGDSITVELTRPEKSGLIVRSITGLGPPKATINTTKVLTGDGSLYNSSRLNERNIVIKFDFLNFMSGKSIEDIRQMTYKYFPIKKKITLFFKTDNVYAKIDGRVESNEPNIFDKNEGCQISILCPNPMFFNANTDKRQVTEFSSEEPLFEFPFSNESLTEPMLEMSEIHLTTTGNVHYKGNSETGIVIHIYTIGPARNLTITSLMTGGTMSIDTDKIQTITGAPYQAGDEIIITTIKGNKSVVLLRDGVRYNILNALGRHSKWFYIYKGDNLFSFNAQTGIANLRFRIENDEIYEGI